MVNISRNPSVRRTKPLFQLTNVMDVTIRRRVGAWLKGRWVENDVPEDITIEANVQPLKFTEIFQMPESERTKKWIKLFTTYHVVTAEESAETGNPADAILWEGHWYRAMQEKHYRMGVLDHRCVYAAREPISALGD